MLTRRDTLWGMGGLSLTLGACGQAGSARSQHQSERNLLKIPQLLSGKKNGAYTEYNLKIQNGTSTFFEGRPTSTIGVNQAYLGPTLKMDVMTKLLLPNLLRQVLKLVLEQQPLPLQLVTGLILQIVPLRLKFKTQPHQMQYVVHLLIFL